MIIDHKNVIRENYGLSEGLIATQIDDQKVLRDSNLVRKKNEKRSMSVPGI